MSEKVVPTVVTLSGTVEIAVTEGMTAGDVKEYVMKHWNIDESQTNDSFVVMADMITNASTLCQDEEELYSKLKQNGVLRVVLPLMPKE